MAANNDKYTGGLFEKAFGNYGVNITDDILDAAFNDIGFVKEVSAESIAVWKRVFIERLSNKEVAEEFSISTEQVKYKVKKVSTCLRSGAELYQNGVEPFFGTGNARHLVSRYFHPPVTPHSVTSRNDLKVMIENGHIYPGMILCSESPKPETLSEVKFKNLCDAVDIDGNMIIDSIQQKRESELESAQKQKLSKTIHDAIELLEGHGYIVTKK